MSIPQKYEDQLPVTQEWVDAHEGEDWTFTLLFLLDDIIFMDGMDAMNEACDLQTGTVLTGLVYRVGPEDAANVDNSVVIIEATGTVEQS